MERPILRGSADELAERVRAYCTAGFTNVVFHLAPPYDGETLERFIAEVKSRRSPDGDRLLHRGRAPAPGARAISMALATMPRCLMPDCHG